MMAVVDPARSACAERCAEFGEPPCYEICGGEGVPWTACSDCLMDIGCDPIETIDPAAVIRNLI